MGRVEEHPNAIRALLTDPNGGVTRDLLRRAYRVQAKAREEVGVDTGRLRNSISVVPGLNTAGEPAVEVGTNVSYARYHHDGVGLWGSGQPIRPVRAKVLRFKPKGSNVFIFAKEVKGYKGTKFLTKALDAAAD